MWVHRCMGLKVIGFSFVGAHEGAETQRLVLIVMWWCVRGEQASLCCVILNHVYAPSFNPCSSSCWGIHRSKSSESFDKLRFPHCSSIAMHRPSIQPRVALRNRLNRISHLLATPSTSGAQGHSRPPHIDKRSVDGSKPEQNPKANRGHRTDILFDSAAPPQDPNASGGSVCRDAVNKSLACCRFH